MSLTKKVGEAELIQIDMQMPEKCSDCIFCDDNCSCVASDYNGTGINVGCAYRTGRRDIRCPLKEHETANLYKCPNCGTWVSAENVVRCKDCKHRPIKPNDYENGFDLEFPDNKCPCQNGDDGWYSWYPADNWYCADGERR